MEARLTDKIVSLGARLGMYEMMRTGTTAFVDSYLLEANVLQEAERMGMRCVGGEVVFAFPLSGIRRVGRCGSPVPGAGGTIFRLAAECRRP